MTRILLSVALLVLLSSLPCAFAQSSVIQLDPSVLDQLDQEPGGLSLELHKKRATSLKGIKAFRLQVNSINSEGGKPIRDTELEAKVRASLAATFTQHGIRLVPGPIWDGGPAISIFCGRSSDFRQTSLSVLDEVYFPRNPNQRFRFITWSATDKRQNCSLALQAESLISKFIESWSLANELQ